MATPFDWQGFVRDNRDRLNIVDETSFWQFWRYYFCGNEINRNRWRQSDPHFQRHTDEVRRVVDLAKKLNQLDKKNR